MSQPFDATSSPSDTTCDRWSCDRWSCKSVTDEASQVCQPHEQHVGPCQSKQSQEPCLEAQCKDPGAAHESAWIYTEKECLTPVEFKVLCDVKAHLEATGVGIASCGMFQDSLLHLQAPSLVVFAFFPTPQLMRGSADAWLQDLVSQTQQMTQALTLVVTHSKQFLQRLQLNPALALEKGAVTDPPFPVAAAHRFEQELHKCRKARLYRTAAGSSGASMGACSVGTVVFKNKVAAEGPGELPGLIADVATQVIFFGEGAGLGMLSVSDMLSAVQSDAQCVSVKLHTLEKELRAERVHPNTTTLPWSQVLLRLNDQASTGAKCVAGHGVAGGSVGKGSNQGPVIGVIHPESRTKRTELVHHSVQS